MIVLYRLLQPYRINKVLQPAGHELEMPEQTGAWLVEQGYMERLSPTTLPIPRAVSTAAPTPPTFTPKPTVRWSCCGPRKP